MHAILFQMALLPLTMARQTVAALSNTYIGRKFVPLHKVVAMHVHLGYVMCSFVFAATIIFFAFFGLFRLGFSALSGVEAVTASLFRFFFDMSSISSPAPGLSIT